MVCFFVCNAFNSAFQAALSSGSLAILGATRPWPDAVDIGILLAFFGGIAALLLVGYIVMVLDIRAWMRALRGVMVRVTRHFAHIPEWARYETPGCLIALGLRLPCTREQVKKAYREKAEKLHPDRGGDRRKFMQLQGHFENAIRFLGDFEEDLQRAE